MKIRCNDIKYTAAFKVGNINLLIWPERDRNRFLFADTGLNAKQVKTSAPHVMLVAMHLSFSFEFNLRILHYLILLSW